MCGSRYTHSAAWKGIHRSARFLNETSKILAVEMLLGSIGMSVYGLDTAYDILLRLSSSIGKLFLLMHPSYELYGKPLLISQKPKATNTTINIYYLYINLS